MLIDNWKKINTNPVCFGTKNGDFGSFEIQEAGKIYTFKLVHTKGTVTCDTDYGPTKWGCLHPYLRNHRLLTVITYPNKTVLPLAEFAKGSDDYRYQLDRAHVNSPTLVFNLLPTPLVVSIGQQFLIWYGQDLTNFTEYNNAGETCTDVYALYPSPELQH